MVRALWVPVDTLNTMRSQDVLKATIKRIQRPVTWGAILLFGLLWNLTPWSLGMGFPPPNEIVFPFLWGFAVLALSPVPWQWTADERRIVPLSRGLLQALPWNALWALGLLLLMAVSHPEHVMGRQWREGRRGPEPGLHHDGPPGRPPFPPRSLILLGANLSFGMLLGWILADKERAEAGENAAIRAAGEAKARALQSQMNPHVLFNAIGGLTELVREDPAATERALVSLSELLRSLLEYSSKRTVPLAQERALVERYLALEQIRLGKRLRVEWRWDEALENLEVPPLLLQPLVENALKHGIAPHRGGGALSIVLRRTVGETELEVANTGEPLAEKPVEGIGLRNLKERLELFLPRASLRIFRDGDWTRVVLALGEDPA